MKYIYYVIAVMLIFSGLAAYGLFDTRIEISKPYLSVNDRIFSENEFEKMLVRKPPHMTREQFVDSVIEKQLLIQEAVKMKINQEENFRQTVENFYEQSLIKTLVDRKLKDLKVEVTNDEIEKYRIYRQYTFHLTKQVFPSMSSTTDPNTAVIEVLEKDFLSLSDNLKFIVMQLNPGQSSAPRMDSFGRVSVYTLDRMVKKQDLTNLGEFDIKRVSLMIRDQKKNQLMDEWIAQIRKSADIWRKK